MKRLALLVCFLPTFVLLQAQNDKPFREAFTLHLKVDSTSYYSQEVNKTPYFVKDNALQIYPGEKLFIEVELKNNVISAMKTVNKNLFPEKTITVDFYQITGNKKDTGMFLNVQNPFNKTLNHKAFMFTTNSNTLQPTSIIPIRAKLENFETWGYPIISLVLVEWSLTD